MIQQASCEPLVSDIKTCIPIFFLCSPFVYLSRPESATAPAAHRDLEGEFVESWFSYNEFGSLIPCVVFGVKSGEGSPGAQQEDLRVLLQGCDLLGLLLHKPPVQGRRSPRPIGCSWPKCPGES